MKAFKSKTKFSQTVYETMIDMWDDLITNPELTEDEQAEHLEALIRSTADVPIAIRQMSGLANIHAMLIEGKKQKKIGGFFVILLTIVLNFYSVGHTAHAALTLWQGGGGDITFGGNYGKVILKGDGEIRVCSPPPNVSDPEALFPFANEYFAKEDAEHGDSVGAHLKEFKELYYSELGKSWNDSDWADRAACDVYHVHGRYKSFQILCGVEFVILCMLGILILYVSLPVLFLTNKDSRARWVGGHVFLILVIPNFTARFTLFKALVFMNGSMTIKALLRGDLELVIMLFLTSICPSMKKTAAAGMFSYNNRLEKFCSQLVCGIIILIIVLVGLQMLLIKVLSIFFVVFTDYTTWRLNRFLLLLGFVNQITGIFDQSLMEMNAILLMRYGGEDGDWYQRSNKQGGTFSHEWQDVAQYLMLVGRKLVTGRAATEQYKEITQLAVLWTFSPADLQKMILDSKRERDIESMNGRRKALFIAAYAYPEGAYDTGSSDQATAKQNKAARQKKVQEVQNIELENINLMRDHLLQEMTDYASIIGTDKDDGECIAVGGNRPEKYRFLAEVRERLSSMCTTTLEDKVIQVGSYIKVLRDIKTTNSRKHGDEPQMFVAAGVTGKVINIDDDGCFIIGDHSAEQETELKIKEVYMGGHCIFDADHESDSDSEALKPKAVKSSTRSIRTAAEIEEHYYSEDSDSSSSSNKGLCNRGP